MRRLSGRPHRWDPALSKLRPLDLLPPLDPPRLSDLVLWKLRLWTQRRRSDLPHPWDLPRLLGRVPSKLRPLDQPRPLGLPPPSRQLNP